jgi:Fe-S-cluster containining protein
MEGVSSNPASVKTCPGLCCEDMGGIHVTLDRGERIGESVYVDLVWMDLHRYRQPWYGYMHDNMLQVTAIIDGHEEYTCKLFDKATGCCTKYETRPPLCRSYPDDHPCWHCTYDPQFPDLPGVPYRPIADTGIFPIE